MKRNILLFLMSPLFFMVGGTQAQEWSCEDSCCYEDCWVGDGTNFYAKILAGPNFLENTTITQNRTTYDAGFIISASLGYRWCYGLRLEGEYAYRRNEISKIHLYGQGSSKTGYFQTSSVMANLLWDVPLSSWGCEFWNIQPFFGAGIGYDFQQMRSSTSRIVFRQNWNHFSWQLTAGLAYPIFCNTDVTLEYTFHQGGCHFNNHSLGVGLVYKFDFLR